MIFERIPLDKYPCALCQHTFRRERLRADHLRDHHKAAKPYLCYKCPSAYHSQRVLDRHHRQKHYSPLARVRRCGLCKFKTDARDVMLRHMQHDHGMHACESCGRRDDPRQADVVADSVHFLHVHEELGGCGLCGEVWAEGQRAGHLYHICGVEEDTRECRRAMKAEKRKAAEQSALRKMAEHAKALANEAALATTRIDSPTSSLPPQPVLKSSGFNPDHDAFLALQMAEFARLPKQEQEDMLDPVKRHQRGVLGSKGEYDDEVGGDEDFGALAKFAD